MTPEMAAAIIEGFKKDGRCGALPHELFNGKFYKVTWPIRAWLPNVLKEASDAIWDGNEEKAFNLLCKLKNVKRDDAAGNRYTREANNAYHKKKFRGKGLERLAWREFKGKSGHGPANKKTGRIKK